MAETYTPKKTTTKQPIQWDWIEAQWMRGTISNHQIAKNHEEEFGRSVAESAIRKRASSYGWQRDLNETIRREAKTRLLAQEVRESAQDTAQGGCAPGTEEEILSLAADALVKIEQRHRQQLIGISRIADIMGAYAALALPVGGDGLPAHTYEPGELKDVMSAAKSAIGSRAQVIQLERRIFGMDGKKEETTTAEGRVPIFGQPAIVVVARRSDAELTEGDSTDNPPDDTDKA
jgi:hypothetical protein